MNRTARLWFVAAGHSETAAQVEGVGATLHSASAISNLPQFSNRHSVLPSDIPACHPSTSRPYWYSNRPRKKSHNTPLT